MSKAICLPVKGGGQIKVRMTVEDMAEYIRHQPGNHRYLWSTVRDSKRPPTHFYSKMEGKLVRIDSGTRRETRKSEHRTLNIEH